jgi:predicted transcriptional regulator
MRQTKVEQVDCSTGEVQRGVNVFIPDKRKLRGGFMLLDLEGMERLVMDRDIDLADWRVLGTIMRRLEYENWLYITQQEIANEIGMKRQNVTRSIKKLTEKAIIVKERKSGRSNCYRLNAFYGWKGRINKEYESTYETHSKLLS